MEIKGNLEGVKAFCLKELQNLEAVPTMGRTLATPELCAAMLAFTHKYNRELVAYLDNRGRLLAMGLGDHNSVQIADFKGKETKINCIHTHPSGMGVLSLADITAAQNNDFLAMSCIALDEKGGFKAAAMLLRGEKEQRYFASTEEFCAFELPVLSQKQEEVAEGPVRALLVSLSLARSALEMHSSLEELAALAETAGIVVVKSYIQNAIKPVSATYIGKGKSEELKMEAQVLSAELIVFDDEINPTQLHNLEQIIGCRIIDRTMLILDIFAARAHSNEGKLQVELAQLKYMLPRLTGQSSGLSRLGGGIGMRGPGETKLETDRRKIRIRLAELEERLAKVEKERALQRDNREAAKIPTVALVGYTNAGKSTLLNAMSGEATFSADLLFATLDTLTRRIEPSQATPFLLSDTVGFIRRLPHQLVAAFRATLNELRYADVLLHVINSSSPEAEEQAVAVESVIAELGLQDKPIITVLNKCEIEHEQAEHLALKYHNSLCISAKTGVGIDTLFQRIESMLSELSGESLVQIKLPYDKTAIVSYIHENTKVVSCSYNNDAIVFELKARSCVIGFLKKQGIIVTEVH